MTSFRSHLLKIGFAACLTASILGFVQVASVEAQETVTGLEAVAQVSGLGLQDDPTVIVARLIRTGLTLLGVIAVVIVMYGGFVWMTAGGNAERVAKAKRILLNGVIGLAIIIMSWAITTFVINALSEATGRTTGDDTTQGGFTLGLGGGSSSSFEVTAILPTGVLSIRNVEVQITFSKNVDQQTVDANSIKITDANTGVDIVGTLETSGNKITFVPSAPCPDPNTDRFCFDANTLYNVNIDDSLQSSTGIRLSCANGKCSGQFTTGDLVDIADPSVEATLPESGDGVSVDALIDTQAHGTDDAGVAVIDFAVDGVIFDSVPGTGDLTNVVVNTLWDTTGLTLGQSYEITMTANDLAGNTDEDSVVVVARSAQCFDGLQNGVETGIDCGGDPVSSEYCGACDGGSCTQNADCASGLCLAGVCTTLPKITNVSPLDGLPGTLVTIHGEGFGSLEGSVAFNSASGEVIANLPFCAQDWSQTEIVVEVPDEAIDGSITLTTSTGTVDATDDSYGAFVPDFDVNLVEHPGLCSLSPSIGLASSGVTLEGQNFGDTQGASSTVTFDVTPASSYNAWSNGSVSATVPDLASATYDVTVNVGGIASNALHFSVVSEEIVPPVIVTADPSQGGVGQYVTLTGTNFGSGLGTVWFENVASQEVALATSNDLPAACADNIWFDTQVTVMVPGEFTTGGNLNPGNYNLYLVTSGGVNSNIFSFTVTDDSPTPGLCALDPASGLAGDAVTLYGDNFGPSAGSAIFFADQSAAIIDWTDNQVAVTVPSGSATGPLVIRDATGTESNPLNFEVSAQDAQAALGEPAEYAWSFSSGEIPAVPAVIFVCDDNQISGVPNDALGNEAACVNADAFVEFTLDMDEASLEDSFSLAKCIGSSQNPCDALEAVSGDFQITSTTLRFTPLQDFDVSSLYQITIGAQATSALGVPLGEDVSWNFTTRDDANRCGVLSVIVSPPSATITELYGDAQYQALPVNGCSVLNDALYSWLWSVDPSYARLVTTSDTECAGGTSSCATVEGLAEGTTLVTAEERFTTVSDTAELAINFSDPYIVNEWPNCEEACPNAEVGASFNTAMDQASLEALGAVTLFVCSNELCTTLTPVVQAKAACTFDTNNDCTGFAMNSLTLTPGTFYRVIVAGDVVSTSGVSLIRTNYGGDYSWTFRVRQDGTACAVDRITIDPVDTLLKVIGDAQAYSASAYGAADACSVSGQRLSGFDYSWSWIDPIDDADLDNDATTVVAEWEANGQIDTDPGSIAEGCTASCLAGGSSPYDAICGDSTIDNLAGEECEDGNVSNGDGCSAACLREGANTFGVCGNNLIDRQATGAGEDCDDGNVISGDGCSDDCLAEGSGTIGATCGNSDIAVADTVTLAGEECDDGNALRGDGCSAECLNEGSPTLASIGGAICGNGVIEVPAENCDDSNVLNEDGCSENCLLEGSSNSYATPSKCGDGVIGMGEECDDSDSLGGDGCGASCLFEGSSTNYQPPSFCGDGLVALGELAACEVTAGGDGQIDPLQVAAIADGAVFEVDQVTGEAMATIEVSEDSSRLATTATLRLACSAESDLDCLDPVNYGAGVGNCCVERPTGDLYPKGSQVCRNAALYGIFDREMDLSSFIYEDSSSGATVLKYRMYARLDVTTNGGFCPSDHTTLAGVPRSPLVRFWHRILSLLGRPVSAAAGDCVAPIVDVQQTALDSDSYQVQLLTDALLAANTRYTLVVEGDEDVTDGATDGVLSRLGGGLNGTLLETFSVGSEVCTFDAVAIDDTDLETPFAFSQTNEEHLFVAQAISYTTGIPQTISPIDGVYSWDWTAWSSEDDGQILDVVQDVAKPDQAMVTAEGDNGETTVIATATITDNTAGVVSEEVINGAAKVTVFLCENPWPAVDSFPWTDSEASLLDGADLGQGWTNFSTMYCRDSGAEGTVDDLPTVTVVRPPFSASSGVFKEYLFEISDGSGDAIGFRIVSNPLYLSPLAWYESQGFVGTPNELLVDGFAAVEDGRTTYVVAPNETDTGEIYSNVYAISYNEGASETSKQIYAGLLENLRFVINVTDIGLCVAADGVSYLSTDSGDPVTCSSNLDCSSDIGATCADLKAKIRRDSARLGDLTDIQSIVNDYHAQNGVVPNLPAGTFVRGLSSSIWESWLSILGGGLGVASLSADPLNDYVDCGVEGGLFNAYDAETCVDETNGNYVCPVGSYAYHYQAVGSVATNLYTDLEYDSGAWVTPIDANSLDAVTITVGNSASTATGFTPSAFCSGTTIYGSSASCGDGVVGSDELCEIGQLGGTAVTCTTADGLSGNRSQICDSSCTGFVDDVNALCIVATCGDGVIDAGEYCDDGSKNGAYGFCGQDCTFDTAFYCGDGLLAGGEACDCGVPGTDNTNSRAFGGVPASCNGNFNGDYDSSPSATCAWDCSGPAAYCGDSTLDSGEVCDGANETWSGQLCSGSSPVGFRNEPCVSDADCGGGVCGGTGSGSRAACEVGYTRVKTCDDAAGASCAYTENDWFNIACTEIGACGDGVVDPGEECDDGNTDGTDSCTSACTLNVCGDAYVYVGQEQCDEGVNNGQGCDSAYGSSCTACSLSCRYEVESGEFCGDGVLNGDEYCDAAQIPYQYYDGPTDSTHGICYELGTTITDNGVTYTCRNVGLCSGGLNNGEFCTLGGALEDIATCALGSSCVAPACADNCLSACPFTYDSQNLLVTANQPGSKALTTANLYTYSADSTSVLPNAATITVPACTVATGFTADVSLSNVELPQTYIVFITDESRTMRNEVANSSLPEPGEGSRLSVAVDSMEKAIELLFNDLGENVQIGLIGYKGLVAGECFITTNACIQDSDCSAVTAGDFCNDTDSSLSTGVPFGDTTNGFLAEDQKAELLAEINGYFPDVKGATYDGDYYGHGSGHGTFTYEAFEQTLDLFEAQGGQTGTANARYIAILLSDGQWTSYDPNIAADNMKDFGYEVYTAVLSTVDEYIDNMEAWSSNEPGQGVGANGVDYSYQADTEVELEAMYEQIIDSILSIGVTLTASSNGTATQTIGNIKEGANIPLPFPEGFVCDPEAEQEIPIQFTFPGVGLIEVSNVRMNSCAP